MHRRRVRKAAGGAAPFVTAVLALAAGVGVASAPLPPVPELPTSPLSDDAFYVPPSPLPNGKPGDVIKIQDLPLSTYPNAHVRRIMYLSTDTRDNPVPVTGMLLTPLRQKPGTDNPLVVHTPGTRGLDDKCAPSKQSCIIELFAAFGTTTVGQVTNPDVLSDPAWQKGFRASRLGTTKPGAPAYLYHGTSDPIVPIAQADMLYHDWCAQGASVQYETVLGGEHIAA